MGKINPATGRDHSEDARLYALRDREQKQMEKENKETRKMLQQNQSRRKADRN